MEHPILKDYTLFHSFIKSHEYIKRRSLRISNRLNNISYGTGTGIFDRYGREVINNEVGLGVFDIYGRELVTGTGVFNTDGRELTFEEYDVLFDEIRETIQSEKEAFRENNDVTIVHFKDPCECESKSVIIINTFSPVEETFAKYAIYCERSNGVLLNYRHYCGIRIFDQNNSRFLDLTIEALQPSCVYDLCICHHIKTKKMKSKIGNNV